VSQEPTEGARMPFEYVWKPAPRDMSLPFFQELPKGFVENYVWSFIRQIRMAANSKYESAYFCYSKECNGWVLGEPMENEEYTILSGRDGIAYYCCRCGHEISFVDRTL
jgi:hypothetical protein